MARGFNRGQLPQALAQFLGLKGDFSLQIEELMLPTLSLGDITDSPYLKFATPVGEQNAAAAVVGELGHVGISPGPNVVLQVTEVHVLNGSGAAVRYDLMLMTAADIATVGMADPVQVVDLAGEVSAAGDRRSSVIRQDTHATAVGNGIAAFVVGAGQTASFVIPKPGIFLRGNDPNGIPAVAVVPTTANLAVVASFFGREWPLPG